MYRAVHTGPKALFGGLQPGLFSFCENISRNVKNCWLIKVPNDYKPISHLVPCGHIFNCDDWPSPTPNVGEYHGTDHSVVDHLYNPLMTMILELKGKINSAQARRWSHTYVSLQIFANNYNFLAHNCPRLNVADWRWTLQWWWKSVSTGDGDHSV